MRITPTAAALLAAATLTACSSSSNGDPVAVTSARSGPTSFPSVSPAPATSSATTADTAALEKTKAALLSEDEIGGGFALTPSDPDDEDSPLPCDPSKPPLSRQFPADVTAEAEFAGADNSAYVGEQIETYADADTVRQVIAAGEKGLSCGTATDPDSGVTATIDGPTDLTSALSAPVDKAEAWSVTSKAADAMLVIVHQGTHLVVFTFAADPSVDTDTLPDPAEVISTAVLKVSAELD